MLRDRDGENLREHLIRTAARLLDERGSAGLAVRDIAREAQVADGALYNYFEDKDDLLAQALLAHVATVMSETPRMPEAGTGTVAENLTVFIDRGMASLYRVVPAFAGLMSQPGVLRRFHEMVGGDQAFAAPAGEQDQGREPGQAGPEGVAETRRPGSGTRPDRDQEQPGRGRPGARPASRAACRRSCCTTCGVNVSSAGSTPAPTSTPRPPWSWAPFTARCCPGSCSPRPAPGPTPRPASRPSWPGPPCAAWTPGRPDSCPGVYLPAARVRARAPGARARHERRANSDPAR